MHFIWAEKEKKLNEKSDESVGERERRREDKDDRAVRRFFVGPIRLVVQIFIGSANMSAFLLVI